LKEHVLAKTRAAQTKAVYGKERAAREASRLLFLGGSTMREE
jgi:hypothetical protein